MIRVTDGLSTNEEKGNVRSNTILDVSDSKEITVLVIGRNVNTVDTIPLKARKDVVDNVVTVLALSFVGHIQEGMDSVRVHV